ncbi:hypothetical protein ABG805_01910, partial [Bifidobacterium adolescentis]
AHVAFTGTRLARVPVLFYPRLPPPQSQTCFPCLPHLPHIPFSALSPVFSASFDGQMMQKTMA